jgi:hypothetical protein
MQECARHRREDAWNGQSYRNRQNAKREKQILLDGPHRLSGETQQVGQLRQVIGQKRDLCCFKSHIRATPTLAVASAGPSFTPSPTKATLCP